jgi:hypothetical protein
MLKRKGMLLGWAAVAGLGVAAVLWWSAEYPSRPALKAQGEQLIVAIERYRDRYGVYPQSLADGGITPPWHGYGPWRYESSGDYFSITVGDYGRDWFELSYVSGGRGWYLDE